jgi:outer membrane protein assembly factor BamB
MRWRYRTGDVVSSSAAFHDGAAVIGSRDGVLYSLNLTDGEARWRNEGHSEIDVIPHIEEDVVYFGTGQGHLLAADVRTGETLWRLSDDGNIVFHSSPTTHRELVVSGGGGNRLRAWNKTTREKVWEYNPEMWVQSSVAIRGEVAYVGSDDGWLHAVDVRTGKLKWKFAAELPDPPNLQPGTTGDPVITPSGHRSNVLSTPRFYKNMVFITSIRGVVYGVNADSGEEVWRHLGERIVTDTTVSNDGVVYTHSDAAILRAYDARTGRVLWANKTGTNKNVWNGPYQTGSAAVIHGDELIIGGRDGDITSYNRLTGRYIWSFRTGLWTQSTPKIYGDVLVIGSNDGWVYAINLN